MPRPAKPARTYMTFKRRPYRKSISPSPFRRRASLKGWETRRKRYGKSGRRG